MFEVKSNIKTVNSAINKLADRGKKALWKALWSAGDVARTITQRELPLHFKIRSAWTKKGIRVRPKNKERLEVSVGTVDPFMVAQEMGGTKSRKGAEQAVPITARGSSGQMQTLRSRWPGQMVKKGKAFIVRTGSNVGLVLGGKEGSKGRHRVLYVLLGRGVKIKAKWNFRARVNQVARQLVPVLFKNELINIMKG